MKKQKKQLIDSESSENSSISDEKPKNHTKTPAWLIVVFCIAGVGAMAGLTFGGWKLINTYAMPAMTLLGDGSETIPVFGTYSEQGVSASVFGRDYSGEVTVDGRVDPNTTGDYLITYTLRYHNHLFHLKRMVHVVDVTPPVLTLLGESEMTVSAKHLYTEPGCMANDDYDGDLSAAVVTTQTDTPNGFIVTYTVQDHAQNQSSLTRLVTVKDTVPPVLTLSGDTEICVVQGEWYDEPGYAATDDADGDLTANVTIAGNVDTSVPGTYQLNYTVSDGGGNTVSAKRNVVVYTPQPNGSTIYLTFDDGPSSNVTPRILDILKENGITATFFLVNYSDDNAALVQRMVQEGHTVAIHCYSHDYRQIYSSDDAFMQNIYRMQERIEQTTGYRPNILRFPGGSSNTVSAAYNDGIMSRLVKKVQEAGFRYFDWNISSGDASGNGVDGQSIVANVTGALRSDRSANVVLMHDSGAKSTSADALQSIITYGKNHGYSFAAIDNNTPTVHHGVNN